ncbi:MAG: winged helix-turn-helix domain-containing protein [Candidatus Omnitrophica bacterium]|nr:winged helix-turn-helix domain-containing protein [Candidatus Omnitrophota bacterium]
MIIEIGIVAGEIWHYLDQHGEVNFSSLVKELDRSPDNILMSLGWLAREGHVILVKIDNDYHISLRKDA